MILRVWFVLGKYVCLLFCMVCVCMIVFASS